MGTASLYVLYLIVFHPEELPDCVIFPNESTDNTDNTSITATKALHMRIKLI